MKLAILAKGICSHDSRTDSGKMLGEVKTINITHSSSDLTKVSALQRASLANTIVFVESIKVSTMQCSRLLSKQGNANNARVTQVHSCTSIPSISFQHSCHGASHTQQTQHSLKIQQR